MKSFLPLFGICRAGFENGMRVKTFRSITTACAVMFGVVPWFFHPQPALAEAPSAASDPWNTGIAALEQKDSAAAVKAFNEQLASGQTGAEIYYHLGLALSASGNRADASVAFLRALAIDPSLEPARAELTRLAESAGFALPPSNWADSIVRRTGSVALWVFGSVLSWAGLFGVIGGILSQTKRAWLAVPGAVVFLVGAGLHATAWTADPLVADRNLRVIQASAPLPLRSTPVDNAAALERLPAGAPVGLLAERGRWSLVAAPGGREGWVPSENLLSVLPGS